MSEWWGKSTKGNNRITRWWGYSAPFRRRFGLMAGLKTARAFSHVEYQTAVAPPEPVPVPSWTDPIWLRPGTSDTWVYRQLVLGGELDVSLPTPRRIVDGGANIGLASRIFAQRWPEAEIVAVELHPDNVMLLRRNLLDVPRVVVMHGALWGTTGTVSIDPGSFGEMGFRATVTPGGPQVPAWSLGDLFDELGWEHVDLVKLDIEGAEREVLADVAHWLPRVSRVLVELHDRFAPGCSEAFEAAFPSERWVVSTHGEYLLAERRTDDD